MNILITGANGQLGTELQNILSAMCSELGSLLPPFIDANVLAIDLPKHDISNREQLLAFVEQNCPDVIINCAAYTDVDGCERDPDAAFCGNAVGARNVAIAANRVGAKLVHISTDYVFAGDATRPYNECDLCNPQSVYGRTKLLGEEYVRQFCSRHFIVRTSWLYGYTGRNFVKTILRLAREKGQVKVVNDQRGNPTNAVDLAHHILKLAETEEYGTYHCTGKGECSWYEFACEFIKLAGDDCIIYPCSSEEFPSPTKRPSFSSLDNQMLRCTVGDDMRDWKNAIAAYMIHYNKESGEIER